MQFTQKLKAKIQCFAPSLVMEGIGYTTNNATTETGEFFTILGT